MAKWRNQTALGEDKKREWFYFMQIDSGSHLKDWALLKLLFDLIIRVYKRGKCRDQNYTLQGEWCITQIGWGKTTHKSGGHRWIHRYEKYRTGSQGDSHLKTDLQTALYSYCCGSC